MVRDTALGEIVGADPLVAHAGAHLGAAHTVIFRLDPLLLDLIELTCQHPHTFFPVLQLAPLLLAGYHDARGLVDQPDGGGGLVHVLTAGAGGPVDLHFDVGGVDLHVHLLHFREDCHRGGGGVNSSAGFGFGNTLDPVDAGFPLHPGVGPPAVDDEIRLFDAAQLCFIIIQQLHGPVLLGGVHGVHPEQAVGEQGAFLAADAAANLHDDVLVVVGVLGQQQNLQFFKKFFLGGLGLGKFLLGQLLHFRVAHQLQSALHVGFGLFVGMEGLHNGL